VRVCHIPFWLGLTVSAFVLTSIGLLTSLCVGAYLSGIRSRRMVQQQTLFLKSHAPAKHILCAFAILKEGLS
jgi:hypothetical protein